MRFILLLLPNLYDIFTVLMIGYAFILNHNSQLQIPFGIACLLIYATTRIGIFAGKIIHLIIGHSNVQEEGMEQPADVIVKKMLAGILPQCIFIVICQVVFALFFLQNAAAAKFITSDEAKKPQQEQVQTKDEVATDVNTTATKETNVSESSVPAVTDDEYDEEEKITPAVPVKPTVKQNVKPTTRTNVRQTIAPAKKTNVKQEVKAASAPAKPNVYYDIPDRTLQSAGISPAARRSVYSQAATASNSVVPTAGNSTGWTFSATNTNERIVQNSQTFSAQLKQASTSTTLKPKRYPGDDNPLNTNWGYYKYTDKPVSQTQSQGAPVNRTYTIPANTLRSIGN